MNGCVRLTLNKYLEDCKEPEEVSDLDKVYSDPQRIVNSQVSETLLPALVPLQPAMIIF